MLAIIHSLFSPWSGVLSTKYVCSRAIQSSPPPRKMDAAPAQRGNEVSGVQVLVAFGVAQYRLAKSSVDV
ncbi:hypothetical protein J4733_07485 [Klebsiella pneumoniae]|uniref:Uncharacterized protein n=1 Tax=Klebsiella pneumoniae TaxID=573 RepID=A0A939NMA4_KLEPN|nr:hypothetical protein [Klebsiella pneumoniae]